MQALPSPEQLEMPLDTGRLALTRSQMACIEAMGRGACSRIQIAIAAHLDLTQVEQALDLLGKHRLVKKTGHRSWRLTGRARRCEIRAIPDRKRGNRRALGRNALRLLGALSRPMGVGELARQLALSRQGVHNLVVKLHATGHVRLADRDTALRIVARSGDTTPLLAATEQRILSSLTGQYGTTVSKIKRAVRLEAEVVEPLLRRLIEVGLVARTGRAKGTRLYRVTDAGSAHPQYRREAARADPPPLPVRSDRVLAVLSLLEQRGRLRITEVRDALATEHQSINALFQYLKRKSLVRKTGRALRSPYALTSKGRDALAGLLKRRV